MSSRSYVTLGLYMIKFTQSSIVRLLILLSFFPAFSYGMIYESADLLSAPSSFSYFSICITFVLGVLTSLFFVSQVATSQMFISWKFLLATTLSFLGLSYSLLSSFSWQSIAVLISVAPLICCQSFGLLSKLKIVSRKKLNIIKGLTFLSLVTYLVCIAFFKVIDAYVLCLAYVVTIALLAFVPTYIGSYNTQQRLFNMAECLGFVCAGLVIYCWQNIYLTEVIAVLLVSCFYLLSIFNECLNGKYRTQNSLLSEEMNSSGSAVNAFARHHQENSVNVNLDPVTNLPTYQQSLLVFSSLLKEKPQGALVPIVFKPLNFSEVNKVLGHRNSDILLLQLAYKLQKTLVEHEYLLNFNQNGEAIRISRLQGLDFLLVLDTSKRKYAIKKEVELVCNTLEEAIPKAMSFKSVSLKFELAFGSIIPGDAHQGAESLIAQASDALLTSEKNNLHLSYFDPVLALYTEQQLVKMEKLKKDLHNNTITWVVEPQISLVTQTLKGFELSIDWRGSDDKPLSMKEFEEISTFSGELYHVTKKLIQEAFQLLNLLHSRGLYLTVSINLSNKDLLEIELADFIENESRNANVALEYLVVEIDESVLIHAAFRARMMVDQLKVLGVKIAIDHFSGSYESLRFLRRTAIEQVKIDCALIGTIATEKTESIIVNTLINLIRNMNISIVAIGVNNKEIEQSYLAFGGDIAQGFALNERITMQEIEHWLTQRQINVTH